MNVQAETPDDRPTIALADAEGRFEDIYRRWWKPLTYFVAARLNVRHASHAEDIAAETFVEMWTNFLAKGRDVYDPAFGLLCYLARYRIASFYSDLMHEREATVDLGDPVNQRIVAGHSYAIERPDVALLAAELDTALENMNALSKQWRTQHSETARLRTDLESDLKTFTPQTRQTKQDRLDAMLAESARLLKEFRAACALVAELRRDLEATGGPNWQSSTGMPPTAARNHTKGQGTMSEPTRTHCDDGHELTLENTLFTEKGAKRCRTCMAASWRAGREARKAAGLPRIRKGRPVVEREPAIPAETLERARQMLTDDPTLSITRVSAILGVPNSTLWEQVKDLRQGRHQARIAATEKAMVHARALLTDPDHKRSVASVAKELHMSTSTLYAYIPNLSELRAQAYGGVLEGAAR